MRKQSLYAVLAVFLLAFAASATTIVGFDNLPTTQTWHSVTNAWDYVPSNYAGLNWVGWEVMNLDSYNMI